MPKGHRLTLNNLSSRTLRQKWQEARWELHNILCTLQNKRWTRNAQEIQKYPDKQDLHIFHNSVKSIYGPHSCCVTPLKAADGLTLIKGQNQILLRWADQFDTSTPPQITPFWKNYWSIALTMTLANHQRLWRFLQRSLKNNKSPGAYGIEAQQRKKGKPFPSNGGRPTSSPSTSKRVTHLYVITAVGISLLAVPGKVLAKVMLWRLTTAITDPCSLSPNVHSGRPRAWLILSLQYRSSRENVGDSTRINFLVLLTSHHDPCISGSKAHHTPLQLWSMGHLQLPHQLPGTLPHKVLAAHPGTLLAVLLASLWHNYKDILQKYRDQVCPTPT